MRTGVHKEFKQETLDRYARLIEPCVDDPWKWIQVAYPWGEKGTPLEGKRPHAWQKAAAKHIARQLKGMRSGAIPEGPVRLARRSGHGIGKSAFMSMIVGWCLGTMTDARGVVTANTDTQLRGKTWPEVGKWHRMSISYPFFNHNATTLRSIEADHTTSCALE
jgi:hypothetical protein